MARSVGEPTSFFLAGAQATNPLSYEALQMRRKIAEQLAARQRNAPIKNIGEGIFSAASSLSDAAQQRDLESELAQYEQDYGRNVDQVMGRAAEGGGQSPARYASLSPAAAVAPEVASVPEFPGRDTLTAAMVPLPAARPVYDRNRLNAEIEADPSLKTRLLAMAAGEDPANARIILESPFNRAMARDTTLRRELMDTSQRGGYYPPVSFTRGQVPEQALTDVMRGSNVGGETLGFTPTGNASGDFAARRVAAGYYGNAARMRNSGETYVTQESPRQLASLEASRVASAARNNPAIITDIPPATSGSSNAQMAQAGRIGTVPGPFDKPEPVSPAPPSGMLPSRELPSQYEPVAPPKTPKSPEEIDAIRQALRTLDPNRRNFWANVAAEYAKDREYKDKLNEEAYKSGLKIHETERLKSQEYAQTKAKEDFELSERRKKAAQEAEEEAHFGGAGMKAKMETSIAENSKKVSSLPQAMKALRDAQSLLDQGIYTGATTGIKGLGQEAGEFAGMPVDPKLARRQSFDNALKLIFGAYRAGVAGTGSGNPQELEALQEAVGGQKKLQEKAIRETLDRLISIGLNDARTHQRMLATYAGENPNYRRVIYGAHSLPMEYIIPQASVDKFKKHYADDPDVAIERLDRFYHTPGLGQSILDSGR